MLTERRKSRQVRVGDVTIGGDAPIRVQSMTTTKTADINATLQQNDADRGGRRQPLLQPLQAEIGDRRREDQQFGNEHEADGQEQQLGRKTAHDRHHAGVGGGSAGCFGTRLFDAHGLFFARRSISFVQPNTRRKPISFRTIGLSA